MNTKLFILVIIILVAIVAGGVVLYLQSNQLPTVTSVLKVDPGIAVLSPKPREAISSPLVILGSVNGHGWTGFEAQVGTVQVLDASGNELAITYLPATTEWTQLPTSFEATLEFEAISGTQGSLVFHNENASGDPVRDKTFVVPITFK